MTVRAHCVILSGIILAPLVWALMLPSELVAQTNCEEGNGLLDFAQPKAMSAQEVIKKLGTNEAATKEARLHYSYKQDVQELRMSEDSDERKFHTHLLLFILIGVASTLIAYFPPRPSAPFSPSIAI